MLFKKPLPTELKAALDSYIRNTYEPLAEAAADEAVCFESSAPVYREAAPQFSPKRAFGKKAAEYRSPSLRQSEPIPAPCAAMPDLDRELMTLDESFQEMLLRKIDEKGMRDSVCYKRAGVDRKLFSKIRSNPRYKPKKSTAIAFCIALELPFDEATELLRKAGYALSRSSKFDVIVEYFLRSGRYDLNELNIALYEYDQPII